MILNRRSLPPYKVSITYTEPEEESEEPEEIVTVNLYNVYGYNIEIVNDLAISTPIPDNFDLKEELGKCLEFYEIDLGLEDDFDINDCLSEENLNYIVNNKINVLILKTKIVEDDDTYYWYRTYFRFYYDDYNYEIYFYSFYTGLRISVIYIQENDGFVYNVSDNLLIKSTDIEGMKKVYKHTFTLNGNTFSLISYKKESATKLSQLFNEKIISLFVHGSSPGYLTKCSYSFSNWGIDIYAEIVSWAFDGYSFADNILFSGNSSAEDISDTVTFIN